MKGTIVSYPLEVPVGLEATSTAFPEKKTQTAPGEREAGLTYKQQLKQDAMLWAEFLYSEYKHEKALREGAQSKPTHYDKSDA